MPEHISNIVAESCEVGRRGVSGHAHGDAVRPVSRFVTERAHRPRMRETRNLVGRLPCGLVEQSLSANKRD